MRRSTWVLLLALAALPACSRWLAPLYDEVIPTRIPLHAYDLLYPHHLGRSICPLLRCLDHRLDQDQDQDASPATAVCWEGRRPNYF